MTGTTQADTRPASRTRARNGKGTEPYYNAKLQRWQAQYTDRDGKRRTVVAKDRDECWRKWEAALAELEAGTLPDAHRMTVQEHFDDYLENFVRGNKSTATY